MEVILSTVVMASLWDQMILEERKAKAKVLGVRICDVEEEESLVDSLKQSLFLDCATAVSKSIETENLNSKEHSKANSEHGSIIHIDFEHNDELSYTVTTEQKKIEHATNPTVSTDRLMYQKHINRFNNDSGPWHQLVPELVDKILIYMGDVDMCGYLGMASKTVFKPSEAVYRALCEMIYLKQTAKKQLLLSNWVTFKNMIINRPRLRLNGFYTLKTLYSRAPSNDNFWEPKQYASVEVMISL